LGGQSPGWRECFHIHGAADGATSKDRWDGVSMAARMADMGQKDRWAIARRQDREKQPAAVAPSPATTDNLPETSSAGITGPKPTILVIEDEPPLQKFLRLTLMNQN